MNQTNKHGFPARHYYRPTPARITQLPFIASARYASRHGRGYNASLWLVNRNITDPDKATLIGRENAVSASVAKLIRRPLRPIPQRQSNPGRQQSARPHRR